MSKVVLKECTKYDAKLIEVKLIESLNQIGGLDTFIKPGQSVLLKVNLLTIKKPDQAATTHPAFVEALANVFINHGCSVYLADSPGGPFLNPLLKRVYKATGMADIADRLDVTLNHDTSSKHVFSNDSVLYKSMKVCNYLNDMDHVISVSKLKTHAFMTLTGAVKNLFGIVPGLAKADLHMQYPKILDFSNMLIDVCEYIKPTLSFMDGIVAMEGEGPGSGDPKVMNTILTSDNPYHLDYIASKLVKLNPMDVPTIVNSVKRGLLASDFSDVEVVGEVEPFIPENFIHAKTNNIDSGHSANWIKILKRYPNIIKKDCIGCKLCAEVCPANTIDIINKKAVINYKDCISCFCCHEFCPTKAINVKRKFLRNYKNR